MKKNIFICVTFLFLSINLCFAENNINMDFIQNGDKILWDNTNWIKITPENENQYEKFLIKNLAEGEGSCSLYTNKDESFAFALTTSIELIKDGNLILIDNNLLKYSKLVYDNDNRLVEKDLTDDEIKNIFPDYQIYKMSQIDEDNKMWLHKPFLKTLKLILVNDTNKYFHRFSCKSKNAQDENIKGLITISRYGIYNFTHFGERNGKLTFYIR